MMLNSDPRSAIPHFEPAMSRFGTPILCVTWGASMLVGLFLSIDYECRPAVSGRAIASWPGSARISGAVKKSRLIMFLHPHCPCSWASLVGLADTLSRSRRAVAVHVLFFSSQDFTLPAQKSALWAKASTIPDVAITCDEEGAISRSFGASASGTVLLYDETGRLQFSGGITAGRGHVGQNAGSRALTAFLNYERVNDRDHPVFGCPITDVSTSEGSI